MLTPAVILTARVHDIGKIGVLDSILNKPDRLTPEEKRIMDSHVECGAELIARYSDFARGVEIVLHHHERWDGLGYPKGLKGLDIPFLARLPNRAGETVLTGQHIANRRRPYPRISWAIQGSSLNQIRPGLVADPHVDNPIELAGSKLGPARDRSACGHPQFVNHITHLHVPALQCPHLLAQGAA
jgi:HD domain